MLTIQSMWVVLPKVTVWTDPFLPGDKKRGLGGGGWVGGGGAGDDGEGEENSSQKLRLKPG